MSSSLYASKNRTTLSLICAEALCSLPPRGLILELLICFHSGLNKLNLLIKVVKWNAEHYWLDANAINRTEGEGPRLSIAAQIRSTEATVQAVPKGWRDRPVYVFCDFFSSSVSICNGQEILFQQLTLLCQGFFCVLRKNHPKPHLQAFPALMREILCM